MNLNLYVLIIAACSLAKGAAAQQNNASWEGPACPFDDPLHRDQAAINITMDPLLAMWEESTVQNLIVEGLSTLWYKIEINFPLLTATYDVTFNRISGTASYNIDGYLDARPFRQETIPSGNLTGSGFGRFSATNVKFNATASIFLNLASRVQISRLNIAEASFDNFSFDLGANFLIGGEPVNWSELSRNIKDNFDRDLVDNKAAITEKLRVVYNNILKTYTLQDMIDWITEGVEGRECPVPTTTTTTTTVRPTTTTTRSTTVRPTEPPGGSNNGTCNEGLQDGDECDSLVDSNQCGFCDFYFYCRPESGTDGKWTKNKCSMRGDPNKDIIRVEDKMFFHRGATSYGGVCAPGIPPHLEDEYVNDPTCRNPNKFRPDEDCPRAYWFSDPDYSEGIWSEPGTLMLCNVGAKWNQEVLTCVFCEEDEACDCIPEEAF